MVDYLSNMTEAALTKAVAAGSPAGAAASLTVPPEERGRRRRSSGRRRRRNRRRDDSSAATPCPSSVFTVSVVDVRRMIISTSADEEDPDEARMREAVSTLCAARSLGNSLNCSSSRM